MNIGACSEAELDGFDDVGLRLYAARRVCIAGPDARSGHQRGNAIACCEFRIGALFKQQLHRNMIRGLGSADEWRCTGAKHTVGATIELCAIGLAVL